MSGVWPGLDLPCLSLGLSSLLGDCARLSWECEEHALGDEELWSSSTVVLLRGSNALLLELSILRSRSLISPVMLSSNSASEIPNLLQANLDGFSPLSGVDIAL